jgi:hypothetical protein
MILYNLAGSATAITNSLNLVTILIKKTTCQIMSIADLSLAIACIIIVIPNLSIFVLLFWNTT